MKKIYTTGPFGEPYKIVITDEFLERCLQLREIIQQLDLKDDEYAEITKKITTSYPLPDEESYRPIYAKIKAPVITLACYWEEGWETITNEYEHSSKDKKTEERSYRYVSLEKLPDVWFQESFLWNFTEEDSGWKLLPDEKRRHLTCEEFKKLLIDEEDIPLFETKLQEHEKTIRKRKEENH